MDPKTLLLTRVFAETLAKLEANPGTEEAWHDATRALEVSEEGDEAIGQAVANRDADALRAIVDEWRAGTRPLTEHDRAVFKRAMKAYRKRLKLTRLDAESSIAGGPTSSGKSSGIVGITPPNQYPREVWDELVAFGRLVDAGQGMFELPDGA